MRALDTSGWRKDQTAFAEFAAASVDMARGVARAFAKNKTGGGGDDAKRQLSQARMHVRGVVKIAEDKHWEEEMPEVVAELRQCAVEVASAEDEAAAAAAT